MLRNKAATSQPDEFTSGTFRPVIGDDSVNANSVERVIVCSGKVTWDLMAEREKLEAGTSRTAIVRLEQIYPRPVAELNAEVAKFPNAREVRWVQEEPANQGPWPHIALHLSGEFDGLPLSRVSRPESSAPSVGSHQRHVEEQADLVQRAFA
jgi:2-oxoglutarate dehydrogenase E1 component